MNTGGDQIRRETTAASTSKGKIIMIMFRVCASSSSPRASKKLQETLSETFPLPGSLTMMLRAHMCSPTFKFYIILADEILHDGFLRR